jgi:vitamin B12 transporter
MALAAAAALPVQAQTVEADEVVVTATRLPTPLEQVASTVSVITAADIERHQYRTLPDALDAVPGLNVVRTGQAGSATSVFVRGTESNHTLVLLDGMEIIDPSTPDGAFDFSDILLYDVDRIEILRGSQSTLYGSDAIGGVVNIITKRSRKPFDANASLEIGSHTTFNQTAGVGGRQGPLDFRLGIQRFSTEGESITPPRRRPPGTEEDDGNENVNGLINLGLDVSDQVRLEAVGRYVNSETELDVRPEDPNAFRERREAFGRAGAQVTLFDGVFDNRFNAAYSNYDRESKDPPDVLSPAFSASRFEGSKLKFDWQGDLYLIDNHVLTLGAETEEEKADTASAFSSGFSSQTSRKVRTNAYFAQIQSALFERLFTAVGVRLDDHERFGGEVTWRVAPTYLHTETGTRLKGSYGTGFKAPTLVQLFGANFFLPFGQIFAGNPALQPEKSRAYDVGFEQPLFDRRLVFGATYFDIDIKNLIAFNSTFSSLVNVGRAETHGVEAFLDVRPWDIAGLRFDYTFTRSENPTTGTDLLRRPKHKGSATLRVVPFTNAELALSVVYTGRRKDISTINFAQISTSSYTLANLSASFQMTDTWRLFARVNNLFDKDFEPANGFNGQGLTGIVGLRGIF